MTSLPDSFSENLMVAISINSLVRLSFSWRTWSLATRSTLISVLVHSLSKFSRVLTDGLKPFLVRKFSKAANSEMN